MAACNGDLTCLLRLRLFAAAHALGLSDRALVSPNDNVDCMFGMRYISLMQRFDFNLLVALDALLQEGSVRGAAERLSLTAPAMSHALARLRSVLDDPLLVRAGQRLVPTPRAIAIRERVRQAVESGRSILQDRPHDELKGLTRTFTIRANDSTISVLGARLAERVHADAPGIRIRFSGRSEEDIAPLRDGLVDLDIGAMANMGPEICTEPLMQDTFVCAVRSNHPLLMQEVTLQAYASGNHVVASRRGRAHGPIDEILAAVNLIRRVPLIVPDTLAALALAATSDYLATVPRIVARWGAETMKLGIFSLPFPVPSMTMFQSWHPRLSGDFAHQWLRECLAAIARDPA